MRVLACGALGLFLRETTSGNAEKALAAASSARVRIYFLLLFRPEHHRHVVKVIRRFHGFCGAFSSTRQPSLCVDAAIGYSVRLPTLVPRDAL